MKRWAAAIGLLALAACGSPTSPVSTGSPMPTATASATAPVTPSPGPTVSPDPTATASRGSAAPTASTPRPSPRPTPRPTGQAADSPLIVLDPGHSGRPIRSRTTHGLLDVDYPNYPEITEVFDISACVTQGLRADGYRVIMTKQHAADSVSLAERARIANRAHATLAISVHDDHSQGPTFEATYSQRGVPVGGRYPAMYRGVGSRRTVFDKPEVAAASERAAKIIARERTEAQGHDVTVRQNSFDGRPPLEPGNLALVQLLSDVPWVYNEMGALTGGTTAGRLTLAAETGYAAGLLNGIEAAVPMPGAKTPTSAGTMRSCLAARR